MRVLSTHFGISKKHKFFSIFPNLTNFKVCQFKYLEECLKADNCLHFNIDNRLLDCVINLVQKGNMRKNN